MKIPFDKDEARRKYLTYKSPRERRAADMLKLYNVEGKSLRKIGKFFGISGERVRQIISPLGMIKKSFSKPLDRIYICLFCGKENHRFCIPSSRLPKYCNVECRKSHTKKKLGIDTREGLLKWQRERAQKWLLKHRNTPEYRKMVKRNNMRQARRLHAITFEKKCGMCPNQFVANMSFPKKMTCSRKCMYLLIGRQKKLSTGSLS